MALVINHNLMAMNSARNLSDHYGALSTSTQRLSSGLRINSAADDAAGLHGRSWRFGCCRRRGGRLGRGLAGGEGKRQATGEQAEAGHGVSSGQAGACRRAVSWMNCSSEARPLLRVGERCLARPMAAM